MRKKMMYSICLILILSMVSTSMAELVAYYSFDEGTGTTVADGSDNGYDGTIEGTLAWVEGAPGFGSALEFDGDAANYADNYVVCGTFNPTNPDTGALSMAAWIKRAGPYQGAFYSAIVSKGDTAAAATMFEWLIVETSYDYLYTHPVGETGISMGGAPNYGDILTPQDEWIHLAVSFDGTDGTLYANGEVSGTFTATLNQDLADATVFIGTVDYSAWGFVSRFNGVIDEVHFFNHAITQDEVKTAMEGGFGEKGSASGPSPGNGAKDIPRDVVLSWEPGIFADKHDVYLGINFDDVNTSTPTVDPASVYLDRVDPNFYPDTGSLRLEFGQTYYWRIDEVNAPQNPGTYTGDIWSFTIEPVGYPILAENIIATASSSTETQGPENTINGSGLVDDIHSNTIQEMWLTASGEQDPAWIQYEFDKAYKLHEMLVWNYNGLSVLALYGVKDVIVEHSTDGANWTQLDSVSEFAQATSSDNYTYNTIVAFEGAVVKYVRISPQSTWGGGFFDQYGLSEVRFLYIPVDAREPNPDIGATNVAVDTTLSWRAGREAAEHNVYISTDQQAVADGTAYVDTLKQTSYNPSDLELGSVYYWRIEEVNSAETHTNWPGDIWSFSTQEYIVIDDFESYNDIPEDQEGSHLVYIIWEDGYANPLTNGSTMGYPAGASMEADIVKGGMQSVPIMYDNSVAGSSEVTVNTNDLPVGRNWSLGSPETLVLLIRGDLGNAATDQLYVKVNNAKVMYDSDLSIPLWKQWNVDLTSLGISLSNITSLTIGVEGSGSGMFYLDEIALYRIAPPVVEPVDPGTGGLVAHYAMKNNVQDSSGNNLHGTANGNPTYVQGLPGYGMVLVLDGDDDYVDLPIGPTISTLTDCTVATWVNWSGAGGAWQRIFDIGTGTTINMFLTPSNGSVMRFSITTGGGGGESQANASGTLSTGWHHVAVVIDGTSMSLELYLDGEIVASGPTQTLPSNLGNTTQNWLGRSQYDADDYFNGSLDDFRIYDTALSEGQVRYIVGDR